MTPSAAHLPVSARPNDHTTEQGLEVVLRLNGDQVEAIARRVAELIAAPAQPTPAWVDARGAAVHLATSTARIYDLVQLRKLEPRRDGRRLLFRTEDLDAYLESAA